MAEEVFDPDEAWESAILRAFEAAEVPLEEPLPEEEVPGESVVPNPDEEEPETKGGPGSGNFGHEGRPGEVGGSAPGGGGADVAHLIVKDNIGTTTSRKAKALVDQMVKKIPGSHRRGIKSVTFSRSLTKDYERLSAMFRRGGMGSLPKLPPGSYIQGEYNRSKKTIKVSLDSPSKAIPFVFAHEVAHSLWSRLPKSVQKEWRQYSARREHKDRVSSYARTSTEEHFAEAYAVFYARPGRLMLWEPRAYDFFAKKVSKKSEDITDDDATIPNIVGEIEVDGTIYVVVEGEPEPTDEDNDAETKGGPGSGNFGHEGRPGEVGGSAPGSGAGAASRKEGQTLVTRTLVKEGFTYQTRWNRSPRTGFIVSPYKNRERIISQARLKPQDIIAYTRKHRDLLRNRKHFVGGWWNKEKGKVYLDVVIRFDNKRKALTHAEANKQLAIFDLKTKKTIYTRLYYEQEKKSDA